MMILEVVVISGLQELLYVQIIMCKFGKIFHCFEQILQLFRSITIIYNFKQGLEFWND